MQSPLFRLWRGGRDAVPDIERAVSWQELEGPTPADFLYHDDPAFGGVPIPPRESKLSARLPPFDMSRASLLN
jgi:hypothetical protein